MAEARAFSGGGERIAVLAFILACAALFAAMPAWRGGYEPGVESYAMTPDAFEEKVEAQVAAYAAGPGENGVPVVRPPEGDVYMLARRWQFHPVLELEVGRTYRLHVASTDILHGFSMGGTHLLLDPGTAWVVTVRPDRPGRLVIQCSEFCGMGHNKMKDALDFVVPQ